MLDDTDPEVVSDDETLRDRFAMAAVSGVLANPDPNNHVATQSAADIADISYEVADAMLLKRAGKVKRLTFPVDDLDEPFVISEVG
jgi:hypothetical protein